MPSSAIVRVACFAVGAMVGGGVATALAARRRELPRAESAAAVTAAPLGAIQPSPFLDMKAGAVTPASAPSALITSDLPTLKYGYPGTFFTFLDNQSSSTSASQNATR